MASEKLSINDEDLEDGELTDTSDEVYIPLKRPASLSTKPPPTATTSRASVLNNVTTGYGAGTSNRVCGEYDSDASSTTSSDSSGICVDKVKKDKKLRKNRRINGSNMVRISPPNEARVKKYDIWVDALQDDTLTENMKSCDITKTGISDRNVENYKLPLHHGGTKNLKRRRSNSGDELSGDELSGDVDQIQVKKKQRPLCNAMPGPCERLDERRNFRGQENSPYDPRYIDNMKDVANRNVLDVADEMASKLNEDRDDLLVKILQVLGTEIPLIIFKETQRIEAEGGMTVKNHQRRRTPGGIFLFLLKHHQSLSAKDRKAIFADDRLNAKKKQYMKKIMLERYRAQNKVALKHARK